MLKTPSVMTIARGKDAALRRQHPLQVIRIAVGIADDLRAGEAAAVDDAGMVQLVGEDAIVFAHQGRDDSQVGVEARLECDG